MVGILVSFWDGLFSGAMLVLGSVLNSWDIQVPKHFTFLVFEAKLVDLAQVLQAGAPERQARGGGAEQ